MHKLRYIPAACMMLLSSVGLTSCFGDSDEETWNDYAAWRETNENWLAEQQATGLYTKVVPKWNKNLYVLMRWLNDTSLTSGNLSPMLTSEVTVKYKGMLYDGTPFDSTYAYTDSVASLVQTDVIAGWAIALEQMHVGDDVEILIPYQAAYGSSSIGDIDPYSALKFRVKLVDIPAYEIKP